MLIDDIVMSGKQSFGSVDNYANQEKKRVACPPLNRKLFQLLARHCFQFLLGLTMVPRENNAYAKFGGTNKEYYGIFQTGL